MATNLKVDTLSAMGDNFIHVVTAGDRAAVIDPGMAAPVLEYLQRQNLELELIMLTHGHYDHTGGCQELLSETGCRIAGATANAAEHVADGSEIKFGNLAFEALATPGHTSADICYYEPVSKLLFTGDTLFLCGCGRVIAGEEERMWASLNRLRSLPEDSRIYCGHDYTRENLEFALSVEPGNERLQERCRSQQDDPETWSYMETEKATNPFLRPQSREIRKSLQLDAALDWQVFARLRSMKNRF